MNLVQPVLFPSLVLNRGTDGHHTVLSSILKLALLNVKSIRNTTSLIQYLIANEEIDLACIIETWVRGDTDISLQICHPGFSVQHQSRQEGGGAQ